jgi:hypothetical protein
MFWRNFFIMCFILSPALFVFGKILFSGKPKDMIKPAEPYKTDPENRS